MSHALPKYFEFSVLLGNFLKLWMRNLCDFYTCQESTQIHLKIVTKQFV